jgi:hypothetical protein
VRREAFGDSLSQPTADNTDRTEMVGAELVLWRVFGLTDIYEDCPLPGWSVEETRGPGLTTSCKSR